jgi:hypothetical protein
MVSWPIANWLSTQRVLLLQPFVSGFSGEIPGDIGANFSGRARGEIKLSLAVLIAVCKVSQVGLGAIHRERNSLVKLAHLDRIAPGSSGSGKTRTLLSLLNLFPEEFQ